MVFYPGYLQVLQVTRDQLFVRTATHLLAKSPKLIRQERPLVPLHYHLLALSIRAERLLWVVTHRLEEQRVGKLAHVLMLLLCMLDLLGRKHEVLILLLVGLKSISTRSFRYSLLYLAVTDSRLVAGFVVDILAFLVILEEAGLADQWKFL